MGFLDTDIDTKAEINTSNGEHDKFSHYANKHKVTESYVLGTPIIALCGKKWVPSRDPSKYPVCPTCKELFKLLK